MTEYQRNAFKAEHAEALIGVWADITEQSDEETGETITYKTALITGVTGPVMRFIFRMPVRPGVSETQVHYVFLSDVLKVEVM
jgi:hypothetical protein